MTIREIAKLAGVSVATVSRSLNQPEKVSPETRDRILDVIRRTDYVPNPSAQSLSTGQTHTIACIVPTLRNEVFNQMVEGSQKILGRAGYKVLIYSTNNEPHFWERIDQRSIDGIILSGSNLTPEVSHHLVNITVPYILIESPEQLDPACPAPISVFIEDYNGVQQALRYLYAEGNRRFGILSGDDEALLTLRRCRSVKDFFARHPDCDWQLETSPYDSLEQACVTAQRFEKDGRWPTAFFCFNDMLGAGVQRCLIGHGLRVPQDAEVIGFDDIPLSRYLTPSLSTVAAPNRRLGEKAAELLLAHIAGRPVPPSVLYPVELLLRDSTRNLISKEDVY